jgi:hypothetical protein
MTYAQYQALMQANSGSDGIYARWVSSPIEAFLHAETVEFSNADGHTISHSGAGGYASITSYGYTNITNGVTYTTLGPSTNNPTDIANCKCASVEDLSADGTITFTATARPYYKFVGWFPGSGIYDEDGNYVTKDLDVTVGLQGTYYVEIISDKVSETTEIFVPDAQGNSSIEELLNMMGAGAGI